MIGIVHSTLEFYPNPEMPIIPLQMKALASNMLLLLSSLFFMNLFIVGT